MDLSLTGLSVCIAIPVNRDFPYQTTKALMETVTLLTLRKIPHDIKFVVGGSIVEKARSVLVSHFLATTMNRLFWIDSDVSWEPESFLRLLALSSELEVVGAAYPAKRGAGAEFLMDLEPTLSANEFGCLPIKGMGLGFTVCWRGVIEKLAAAAPWVDGDDGARVPMVFRNSVEGNVFRGEDMNFFSDCLKMGVQPWVDPAVELGHVGGKEWRGCLKDALRPAE